jgi:hypothetical protein
MKPSQTEASPQEGQPDTTDKNPRIGKREPATLVAH